MSTWKEGFPPKNTTRAAQTMLSFHAFLASQLPAELVACIDAFKPDFKNKYDDVIAELTYAFLDSDDEDGYETCEDE